MAHKITLLPGDGIGPEDAGAMKRCVEATGGKIAWDEQPVGEFAIKEFGTPLPDKALQSIRKNKTAIKGPIVTPIGKGFSSVNVQLRQALDLFACVRPIQHFEGTKSPVKKIDLVIVRENTEDLYAGIEFDLGTKEVQDVIKLVNSLQAKQIREDSAVSIKPISVFASRRIAKYAFEYAIKNDRK